MTREQATQNIDEIDFLTWQIDIIEDMLDQIFNDHEAELEALQQPKHDCDTCKWDDYCGTEENCLSSKYIKDRYESKGK